MLYVIQTETGKELATVAEIKKKTDISICREVFCIRYESITRREGTYHINTKVLFPAYVFVNTDKPDTLFLELKKIINLSVLLSDKNEKGYDFFSVTDEEEKFLRKLLNDNEDYIVTLSMVVYNSKKKINRAAGPLKYFLNKITEVDSRHRRAFVTMSFLGQTRRLVFGICMKGDNIEHYNMHRLEEELAAYSNVYANGSRYTYGNSDDYERMALNNGHNMYENIVKDYNLKPIEIGDQVVVRNELYGENMLKVLDINGKKNTITIEVEMFGRNQKIEMSGIDVEKVGE